MQPGCWFQTHLPCCYLIVMPGQCCQSSFQLFAPLQANQQVQQAWANVKGKQPLNKRASTLAASASNAGDQLQRQPTNNASDQSQRPANQADQQQGRGSSRDSAPASNQAGNAAPGNSSNTGSFGQSGYGQMQSSLNPGQLAAALSAGPMQPGTSGAQQMPFAGQGDTFIHLYLRSFVQSFVCSITHSFMHPFMHSFMHSFILSFIHSFIHSFVFITHIFPP